MRRGLVFLALIVIVTAGCSAPAAPTAPSGPPPSAATAAPTTAPAASAAPIILGVPTDLGTIEGKDSLNSVKMAVDEINAKGGVDVKGTKRLFQVESIDTREADPGIPVNDAVQAVEKLVLEKKLNAIVVGAFRSEVLPASMDLLTEYKIPYLTTIGMSPVLQQNVTKDYDKYKYFFRIGLNSTYLVTYLSQTMDFLGKNFKFKNAYLVHQDVAWANGTASGVEENLKISGYLRESGQVQESMRWVFEFFPHLTRLRRRKAGLLSGGEQQMLAIGMAMVARPKLLLLDEPLLGLSPAMQGEIVRAMRVIHEQGITILVTEQYARPIFPVIDRGYVMENGTLILSGTGQELMDNPEVKSAYFGI